MSYLKHLIWKSIILADRWSCIVLSLCCVLVLNRVVSLRLLTALLKLAQVFQRIWACCGVGNRFPNSLAVLNGSGRI